MENEFRQILLKLTDPRGGYGRTPEGAAQEGGSSDRRKAVKIDLRIGGVGMNKGLRILAVVGDRKSVV